VTQSGTPALSQAGLCRVLDAYLRRHGARPAETVGTRGNAHLLGRSRSAVIAKIRKGADTSTWGGRRYLVVIDTSSTSRTYRVGKTLDRPTRSTQNRCHV